MANGSNCKFGIQLARSDFVLLQQDATTRKVIGTGREQHELYILDSPVSAFHSSADLELWHRQLGHPSSTTLKYLVSAYYRGAMGILLVYDVTDESSFNNIRNWIRNIEQHASDNVNKILVGNKADMDESKRAVPTSKGQALADEYGIKFFETSAKTNLNVEQVFFSIARDIKQRLSDTDTKSEDKTIKINNPNQGAAEGQAPQSSCCG